MLCVGTLLTGLRFLNLIFFLVPMLRVGTLPHRSPVQKLYLSGSTSIFPELSPCLAEITVLLNPFANNHIDLRVISKTATGITKIDPGVAAYSGG
jgi:hypothetical protein